MPMAANRSISSGAAPARRATSSQLNSSMARIVRLAAAAPCGRPPPLAPGDPRQAGDGQRADPRLHGDDDVSNARRLTRVAGPGLDEPIELLSACSGGGWCDA